MLLLYVQCVDNKRNETYNKIKNGGRYYGNNKLKHQNRQRY